MIRKFYDMMLDGSSYNDDPCVSDSEIEKQTIIECDCGAHMLKVYSIAHIYNFSSGKARINQSFDLAMFNYGNNRRSLWHRIRIAWNFLRTGKMFSDQLCLTPNEAKKLASFIDESIIPTVQETNP